MRLKVICRCYLLHLLALQVLSVRLFLKGTTKYLSYIHQTLPQQLAHIVAPTGQTSSGYIRVAVQYFRRLAY